MAISSIFFFFFLYLEQIASWHAFKSILGSDAEKSNPLTEENGNLEKTTLSRRVTFTPSNVRDRIC